MSAQRTLAVLLGNGHLGLIDEKIPEVQPGTVQVKVHRSLVSPGTELRGWEALKRQLDQPEAFPEPRRFGYSVAGEVMAVGSGVKNMKPGDRVACIGAGFALHATHAVVPHHLCAPLPKNVTFDQGSYAMLTATALHSLRRGEPEFGEYAAILGLGVVGQLTGMFYKLAGNYVMGWDLNDLRNRIARQWGIDATVLVGRDDPLSATREFTGNHGLDAAALALYGDATKTVALVCQCMKCSPDGHPMGRIIVIGDPKFQYPSEPTNLDIRRAGRTGSGYHDADWEYGKDYPRVFMRWTTRTNLELCMRLISEGKLPVDTLTTHTLAFSKLDDEIQSAIQHPERMLGVVFDMTR